MPETTAAEPFTTPSTIYVEYWPATVYDPAAGKSRGLCRVYLTDTGMHVFWTKPSSGDAPHWSSAIDFEQTTPPNPHARAVGQDIFTADGLMIITPSGGCGCGVQLKRWIPNWARDTSPWPSR
jgi:hypothetical protein